MYFQMLLFKIVLHLDTQTPVSWWANRDLGPVEDCTS